MRTITILLIISLTNYWSSAQVINIGSTGDYPTLEAAENFINAGDTLLLQSQIFSDGTQYLTDLNGTANSPIVIKAEQEHGAIFRGGSEGIHLVRCKHIVIEDIVVEQQTVNAMNIDDGGDYDNPSKHITVRNCIIKDMASNGNNDLLKMSGVDSFLIERCQFLNGGNGGSGVDFVGCHYGTVQDCLFDDSGTSGIQNKGGTQHIRIQRNTFKNISQRALNLGGSTGLQYFRPPLPDPIVDAFEAADLEVFSNIFIGCWAPIAYVGCTRVKVYNNTFYDPENWVIRILQETTVEGFVPASYNEFKNNIVYLSDDLTEVNIGPNTAPNTFEFSNNLWYNASSSNWSPNLPVTDVNQILANPQFTNATNEDFRLEATSPAIGSGLFLDAPNTDFDQFYFANPPSRGAFEGSDVINSAHIEVNDDFIEVFPNPSAVEVTIDGDFSDADIKLLNASGQVLMDYSNVSAPLTIDTRNLPNGLIYILIECTLHNELLLRKLVKY